MNYFVGSSSQKIFRRGKKIRKTLFWNCNNIRYLFAARLLRRVLLCVNCAGTSDFLEKRESARRISGEKSLLN